MKSFLTTLSYAFATLLFLGLPIGVVHGQEDQDSPLVELIPATIDVPAKGEVEAQLVLRNKSQKELTNIQASWFTSTGIVISQQGENAQTLRPQAAMFWSLRLSQSENGLVQGPVYFRVTFQSDGAAQVLYGTLTVNNRPADQVEEVVSVVPKTSSTLLNEQRPGQVFLVITNKSNQPIRVGEITTRGPAFIKATPELQSVGLDQKGFVNIVARDTINVPVQMTVTDAVLPGKHLFIFQVPVEWGASEHLQKASVIAQQEFDVGILGESEILTALGVPSFLILPGFIIIASFLLLAKLNKRESLEGESVLKTGMNPYFWVIAITLAGAMAFVYPLGTKWIRGTPRDYLVGYGLYDIVVVWLASVLVGIAAWVLFQLAKYFWSWMFVPSETDTPAATLRKLYLQGLGTSLEQVEVLVNSEARTVFLLQRRKQKQEKIWAGPFIEIRRLSAPTRWDWEGWLRGQLQAAQENILPRLTLPARWLLVMTFYRVGTARKYFEIIWRPPTGGAFLLDVPETKGGRGSVIHQD